MESSSDRTEETRPIAYSLVIFIVVAAVIAGGAALKRGPEPNHICPGSLASVSYVSAVNHLRFVYPSCWAVRELSGWVGVYGTPADSPIVQVFLSNSDGVGAAPLSAIDSNYAVARLTGANGQTVVVTRAITNYGPTEDASKSVVDSIELDR